MGWRSTLCSALLAIGSLLYWRLFYSTGTERWDSFRYYILIPDIVAISWCGGDLSRFAIIDRIPVLIAAGVIIGIAYLLGRVAILPFGLFENLTRLEQFLFATAVGLNFESLFTLAMGLCGQLANRWLFLAAALSVCVIAGLQIFRQRSVVRRALLPVESQMTGTSARPPNGTDSMRSLYVLGSPFLACIILGAMMPPWQFDVREYHLQVPKEWFQAGKVMFLPHNVYGNMPLGSEILSVLGMLFFPGELNWWWGSLVGKTLIACFTPLTSLTLLAAGKRFVSTRAGVIAAISYLSIPWIVHESMAGLIEGAVAFYGFASTYALLLWSSDRRLADAATSPSVQRIGWIVLAGFLAGAAAACKYPGALFVSIPLFVWVVAASWERGPSWQTVGAFILAGVVGCGLWYAKNWVMTGNPTYPLFYSVFGGESRTLEKDLQWRTAHRVPVDEHGSAYSLMQLADAISLVGWRSTFLSPILWPFCFASLMVCKHRRLVLLMLALMFYNFAAWWLFTHRIDRFFVPSFVYACVLTGVGATAFDGRIWRKAVFIVLLLGSLGNFLLLNSGLSLEAGDIRYFVALADLRVDLLRTHPTHRYLNQHVRDGSTVLMVGDARPFDLEIPTLYNTCFDSCIFEEIFRDKSKSQRLEALNRLGISHIFVYWREIDRYRSPGNYGFTDYVTRELVNDELVREQGLLKPLPMEDDLESSQLFEVVNHRGGTL